MLYISEALYLQPSQTSMTESFAKIINRYKLLTIFAKDTPLYFKPRMPLFISNEGQDSVLKVTYVVKLFGAQSCLMFA